MLHTNLTMEKETTHEPISVEFKQWLEAKRLMPGTIHNYIYCLQKLGPSFNQESIDYFLGIDNTDTARAFIRNYRDFLIRKKKPDANIAKEIEIPRLTGSKKIRLPHIITQDELKRIEETMNKERNKLMLLISFYCGLRLSELVSVTAWSFAWQKWWNTDKKDMGELKLIGKRNKERLIPVVIPLMNRIEAYIKDVYYPKYQDMNAPLFRIKKRRWAFILSEAGKKALGKHLNPHILRHSCAMWILRDNNKGIEFVKEWLGHADINSTQVYTHLQIEDLKKLDVKTNLI